MRFLDLPTAFIITYWFFSYCSAAFDAFVGSDEVCIVLSLIIYVLGIGVLFIVGY